MPMTTIRSFPIKPPKDIELQELLEEVKEKMGADLYVEEYTETRGVFRKYTYTYYSLLHPIGPENWYEYQIINIGRSKECVMAYLYGVLYNYKGGLK